MSEAQIDYSRPVGWWCARSRRVYADLVHHLDNCPARVAEIGTFRPLIPVYLPIPEGQRPPAASEVEDAKIATGSLRDDSPCCLVTVDAVIAPDNGWDAEIVHLEAYADADHINDIAQASARIVTGATE